MSSGPDRGSERSRDFERFITFIDAVVAIAITLLVLPLVDLTVELHEPITTLLREHLTEIGGFLLSFVVIASSWLAQHRAVSTVIAQDPLVTWLLMLWTLTIVVLPFPTSLVAQSGHEPVAKILYIGTMALTSIVLAVICWAVGRNRSIRDTDAKPDTAHAIGTALGFVLALAISLALPQTSYYPLLLLLVPDRLFSYLRRRKAARSLAD